ncbi:MAG: sulfite oxidase [Actinobacteria bacterium]|nr:sulfite oxidase [Actinomycetota bacterium]
MATETQPDRTGLPEGVAPAGAVSMEELALAARNHGMPLEGLRYDLTPVGLHYLLIHFDIPHLDETAWALSVRGRVRRSLELTLEQVWSRPAVTLPVTMECAGNGRARLDPRPISQPWLHEAVGTAEWTGTPLAPILDEAGVLDDAVEVVFTGHDRGVQGDVEHHYERSLTVDEARRDDVLLAYAVNGQPLPPQHGYPLRLLVPGWYGMTHVKWLRAVTVVAEPFTGYQQVDSYRLRQSKEEPGDPVTRIRVRALMVPPGIPDFLTRRRVLTAGECLLEGRAWSGTAPVTQVEVSTDAGATWRPAELGQPLGRHAWAPWSYRWTAVPGDHVLCCRASDADGNTQPVDQPWNVEGMANNMVQRLPVRVDPPRR